MSECVSKIAEVFVYPGQARIVRRGQVELAEEAQAVVLPDLPLSLAPESVRVAGRGTARVRLLGVEVRRTHYTAPPEQALAELDAQIEQLEDQDREWAGQIEVVQHRLELLRGLAGEAPERLVRGYTWGKTDLGAIQSLLGYVDGAEAEAMAEIRQVEIRRRELGRELERLRRVRQDRQQVSRPDRYAVHVPVEVLTAGSLEVELHYVCRNATWKPLYDLRLDEEAEGGIQVMLGQIAEVSQQTGEDWEGVRLSVSTARPALAAALPELSPWYIDLYRPAPAAGVAKMGLRAAAPQPAGGYVEAEESAVEHAKEMDAYGAPPEAPADIAVAEVSQEGPAVVFTAPGTTSIPADGSAHKVFLGTQELSGDLDWVTAPKLEPHAYRRTRVVNTTPAVLLQGVASLFYGDTFIGSTSVPETPLEGEFEVYLGVDDQVKVQREQVERSVDKGGLVGKVRQMLYGYRIGLHNLRQERVALTVLDQLPVSRHESLKVKLARSAPEVEPGEMGELRWTLEMAPGEERELLFYFQVEMPLEQQVIGLP